MNDKKISIVMAYFNRKEQLKLTLTSIKKSKIVPFEIIICDDGSDKEQILNYSDINYFNLNISIITIKKENKTWINPCIAYNKAIKAATGDIIVIQNPEVYHLYDCLNYIVLNLQPNDWITFNVYGLPDFKTNEIIKKNCDNSDANFDIVLNLENKIGGTEMLMHSGGGWLNNESHFVAYHYLAAIYRIDLINKLDGGFCELYKDGPCWDDDDFVKHIVSKNFKFKMPPFKKGQPMCVHLYHEKSHILNNFEILHKNNGKIFEKRMKQINFQPIVDIYNSPKNERPHPTIIEYQHVIISLVIISTNLRRRFATLVNTIKSFNKFHKIIFDEIILSIDKLENYGDIMTENEIIKFMCENNILKGCQIYFKRGSGMLSNQCNGIGLAKGDIIIYSEDDIIMHKLPSRENIIKLTKNGVITYNKDLLYPGKNKNEDMYLYKRGDQYDEKEFIYCGNEYFYRKDKNRYSTEYDKYSSGRNLSVTFPCAIMKKEIFTKVYNEISKLNYDFRIEAAFSHVVNTSLLETYIFCNNNNIPLEVPWLYRDNSNEIAVSGETIDRDSSKLSLLSKENITIYNDRILSKNYTYVKKSNITIDDLLTKLKKNQHFMYSRYNDGEFIAMVGFNHYNNKFINDSQNDPGNIDSHKYYKEMGDILLNSVNNSENFLLNIQEKYLFQSKLEIWLCDETHTNSCLNTNYIKDIKWNVSVIEDDFSDYMWTNSDKFIKFINTINKKKIIYIGPYWIRDCPILNILHFIEIPITNCWLNKDKIIEDIRSYNDKYKDIVFLFSASMATNAIIEILKLEFLDKHFAIDMGSTFDNFVKNGECNLRNINPLLGFKGNREEHINKIINKILDKK